MVKSAPPRQSVVRLFFLAFSCFLCEGFFLMILRAQNIGGKLTCWAPYLCKRSWPRSLSKGFSRINKIKEKIIYFYSLSVNYNNRSPATGNDSQNGINCHRRAAIIYELTNNILTNNSVAQLYFVMTRIMLFSYGYA
jgi:hypothetical protein